MLGQAEEIFGGFVEWWVRDNISTGMPGLVVDISEYSASGCVKVRPAISRLRSNGQVIGNEEITIDDVLVVWPGGNNSLISCPVYVGMPVWLVFSQRNLEDWIYSDGTQEVVPGDSRHFSMTDAVAFPRMPTSKNHLSPSADNLEIKFNNHLISLRPSGELYVTNGNAKVTLKADGNIEIDPTTTLTILGNVDIQGTLHTTQDINCDTTITGSTDVVGGGKSLKTHLHSNVIRGDGNSGPPA